ncbi:chaperonin 10-like protein, partial [Geopyxis carbonaria]
MSASIPQTMLALVAPTGYTAPSGFTVATIPTPTLTPDSVLIRVHASSINPIDLKKASGATKMFEPATFPYPIGIDVSGTIAAVGSAVIAFTPGDAVFTMLPFANHGSAATFALAPAASLARKPAGLSHAAAASLGAVGVTALGALTAVDARIGLRGKTVFVPAGLSGTGSIALQLAKHVFGAAKTITTVSTRKVAQVPQLLGTGTVDVVVDYTTQDIRDVVGRAGVDFIFDTTGGAAGWWSLVRAGGEVVSIATLPSGKAMAKQLPDMPRVARWGLDGVDAYMRCRASRWGVRYEWFTPAPEGVAELLERLAGWVVEGRVRSVVGRTARLGDVEGVKEGCAEVFGGKGGVGKFVIEVVAEG